MRKGGSTPLPVRFTRIGVGLYTIWDNGGVVGERGRPYRQAGEISGYGRHGPSGNKQWTVRVRGGKVIATNVQSLQEAKNAYTDYRAGAEPDASPAPVTEVVPPVGWVTLVVDAAEWERMDEWRATIFRQMIAAQHNPMQIQAMFNPTSIKGSTCTVRLPEPIADDLIRRHRAAVFAIAK